MRVEIDVPEQLSKKIKALSVLTGNTENIEELLISLMNKVVNDAIVDSLGEGAAPEPMLAGSRSTEVRGVPGKRKAAPVQKFYEDASGIADGLGDDDLDLYLDAPADRDPEALIPQNGLSDHVLDRDMELRDPQHEAKGEAGTFADDISRQSAEDIFSQVSGLPVPAFDVDPRVARRQKNVKTRAKVSSFSGVEEHSI
ncbi:MAG: hypothetical protein MUP21_01280 [Dehalococcoidia bacterium]|nr:hypothetical protein [Dehalococcoidia bacterium]